jgi:hypothetical protein
VNVPSGDVAIAEDNLLNLIYNNYSPTGTPDGKKETLKTITTYLKQEAIKNPISSNYNILILFDPTVMVKADADKIYSAVASFKENKPLLLILYSSGGDAGSAYLIGKLCREYCNDSFIVTVPRYAKSAATIICCAADEIHVGSLSELGPIDPQIDKFPALGLKNSIEHIAELVKKYPDSSEMFARYLSRTLKPINLGYYERVAESAMQYAEKLLSTHKKPLPRSAKDIAYDLVYKYKDHSFVIDKAECVEIFGNNIIKNNTPEYQLGNTIYKALHSIEFYFELRNYSFYLIGSLDAEPTAYIKPNPNP